MRIIDNQKICIQLLCILLMMLIIPFNIGAKEFGPVAKTGIAGESIVYESGSNTTVINDENTPLSSGTIVTGRICYDAFVLDNKKDGLYYQAIS